MLAAVFAFANAIPMAFKRLRNQIEIIYWYYIIYRRIRQRRPQRPRLSRSRPCRRRPCRQQ